MASPQEKFTEKIADISQRLMQTEMNVSALRPYTGPIPPKVYGAGENDDGYSKLTPERYISIRIGDQLSYFGDKTNELAAELTRYYWLIFVAGGVGTLLAALGVEPIVALMTALAAAFASYLQYRQTEYTLVKYNQTLSNLNNAKNMWDGCSKCTMHLQPCVLARTRKTRQRLRNNEHSHTLSISIFDSSRT